MRHGQKTPVNARALRSHAVVEQRRGMLNASHIALLTAYVEALRAAHPDVEFPDFDPLNGVIEADILFLLEKGCQSPGPRASWIQALARVV
jgi:hypothetical protein